MKHFLTIFFLFAWLPLAYGQGAKDAALPYGHGLSIPMAVTAVQTNAQLALHKELLHHIVHEPIIQQIKTVTPTFSPPDMYGLLYFLYDYPFTYLVNPTSKTIKGTAVATLRHANVREAVIASLQKRPLLERYRALFDTQQATQKALQEAMNTLEKNTPSKYVPLQKTSSSGDDTPQKSVVEEVQTYANSLSALLGYQELLSTYSYQWSSPQKAHTALTKLLALAPAAPIIHGALAEVYYQQNKPLQAQHHIAQALPHLTQYAYIHDIHGLNLLQLELPSLATDAFTAAIERDGHTPRYYLHRATTFLARNKMASMCRDFKKACVLGDCSGSQWAYEQKLCLNEPSGKTDPTIAPAEPNEPLWLDKYPALEERHEKKAASE